MASKRGKIKSRAIEILRIHPDGVKFSVLVNQIKEENPDYPLGTVTGSLWNLDATLPDKVVKVSRGLFKLIQFADILSPTETNPVIVDIISKIKEEDFYEPFAEWITNDLEECTKAIPLGGSKFKDKWGTPDVIGINKPKESDIIKYPTEIISAEIKTDTIGLITAFGQACSYKIFSHKSYIVVPKASLQEDIDRLDSLAMIFGIGLILFDSADKESPKFEIRVRASKHEPDMFYVNKYIKLIADDLF
ncbi:MAG: hypothetical protein AAB390_01315 [Patescibacteria group bacterium]